jgi:hypothetical protein
MDKNILQLKDGIERVVNRGEFDRYVNEMKSQSSQDGIQTISGISYKFDATTGFLDIRSFDTPTNENPELTKVYDIRDGSRPFNITNQQRRGATMKMVLT